MSNPIRTIYIICRNKAKNCMKMKPANNFNLRHLISFKQFLGENKIKYGSQIYTEAQASMLPPGYVPAWLLSIYRIINLYHSGLNLQMTN